jgi:hypothetical protein
MLKTFGARQVKYLKIDGASYLLVINSKAPRQFECTFPDRPGESNAGKPCLASGQAHTGPTWTDPTVNLRVQAGTTNEGFCFFAGDLSPAPCGGSCVCRPGMEGSSASTSSRGLNQFSKPAVQLYKYDSSTRYFYEHQQLNLENHTFQPRGADAFQAVSCMPSNINPWKEEGQCFSRKVDGCNCSQVTFAAVADELGPSIVLQWNASAGKFDFMQELSFSGLVHFTHFQAGNDTILVAVSKDPSSKSPVFRLENGVFRNVFNITTHQATHVRYYKRAAENRHFIIVANSGLSFDNLTSNCPVVEEYCPAVYEWVNASVGFIKRQILNITSATASSVFSRFDVVKRENVDYLVVSRNPGQDGAGVEPWSPVYRWTTLMSVEGALYLDGFQPVRKLFSRQARDVEVFDVEGKTIVAMATEGDSIHRMVCPESQSIAKQNMLNRPAFGTSKQECCSKAGDLCVSDGGSGFKVDPLMYGYIEGSSEASPVYSRGETTGITLTSTYSEIFTLDAWPAYQTATEYNCTAETASLSNLVVGQSQVYTIRSSNALDAGAYTDPLVLRPLALPSLPLNLTLQYVSEFNMNVFWKEPKEDGDSGPISDMGTPFPRPSIVSGYRVLVHNGVCTPQKLHDESMQKCSNIPSNGSECCSYLNFDISNVTNVELLAGNLKQAGVTMYQSIFATVYAKNAAGRGSASDNLPIIVLRKPDPVLDLGVIPALGPKRFNISWESPADIGLGEGKPPTAGQMYRYEVTITNQSSVEIGKVCYDLIGELCEQCSCPFKPKKRRVSVEIASSDAEGFLFIKGEPYTFAVALRNDADIGDSRSASSCAIEKAGPPQNPTGTPSGLGQVTLNWYTPLDTGAGVGTNCTADRVIFWLIEASKNPDFVPLLPIKSDVSCTPAQPDQLRTCGKAVSAEEGGRTLTLAPVEGNTFTVRGLEKGTDYYFRVYTENNAGSSLESAPIRVQPVGMATAPRNVRSRVTGDGVVLSFDGPLDTGMGNTYINVSCYYARASTSPLEVVMVDGVWKNAGDAAGLCIDGEQTYLTVSQLQSGAIYYFTVFARTTTGDGEPSSKVIERYIGSPGELSRSSWLLKQSGVRELTFTWSSPSDSGAGPSLKDFALSNYVVMISTVPNNFDNATRYIVPARELYAGLVPDEPVLETYTGQGQHELSTSVEQFADCAQEGRFCSCSGTVRYGTDEAYAEQYVTGGTFCTDAIFGNVAPGFTKYCRCKPGTTSNLFQLSSAPIVNQSDPCSCRSLCKEAPSGTSPLGLQNKFLCALDKEAACLNDQKVGQTAVFGSDIYFCRNSSGAMPIPVSGIGDSCASDSRLNVSAGGSQYVRVCAMKTQSQERNLNRVSFTATGLQPGQLYFFKVHAQNFVGPGPSLGSINGQPMQLPSAPSNLTVVAQGDDVVLSWFVPVDTGYGDGSNELVNYRIERVSIGSSSSCFREVDRSRFVSVLVPASKVAYIIPAEAESFRPITCYRVYAVNQIGQGPASLSGQIKIMEKPDSIREDEFQSAVHSCSRSRFQWLPSIPRMDCAIGWRR